MEPDMDGDPIVIDASYWWQSGIGQIVVRAVSLTGDRVIASHTDEVTGRTFTIITPGSELARVPDDDLNSACNPPPGRL